MSLLDHDRTSGQGLDPLDLPDPIGPLTTFTDRIVRTPDTPQGVEEMLAVEAVDPLTDLDFQRALFILHQLHDRSVAGAADDAEWHPNVVAWWHQLAGRFEDGLVSAVAVPDIALGPLIPLLGAIARKSRPVTSIPGSDAASWDDPMHRAEVRRHPLAHARIAAAAAAAGTSAPTTGAPAATEPLVLADAPVELLVACNLTSHLALHRRLLPALLGHLVWHELTSPADPFAGPTHATVADAYLADHPDEQALAVWGADVTAMVERRLADALGV